jgi:hypothetical protein
MLYLHEPTACCWINIVPGRRNGEFMGYFAIYKLRTLLDYQNDDITTGDQVEGINSYSPGNVIFWCGDINLVKKVA